jgi:hypothetical protein
MILALIALLAVTAAAAAGPAAVAAAAGAAAPSFDPTAPRHLHLAFTEDPTGMLFSWGTGTPIYLPPAAPGTPNATHPAVRLGTAPGAYTLLFSSNYSLEYWGIGDVTHRVNASGLAPRTRYYYIVGDLVLQQWSAEATFVSRPPTGPEEVIDFLAYGDMGYFNGSSTVVQQALAQEIARGERDYAFTTHCGDISYSGLESGPNKVKDTQLWDLFMSEIEPISRAAPYMLSVGNHDALPGDSGIECGAVYLHRFKMPGQNESSTDFSCATSTNTVYWYSFATGPLWLHTWSTEHAYGAGTAQRAWIERDLAAARAAKAAGTVSWIIVQMHYPSYCSHSYNGGGGCIDAAPRMRAELEAAWVAAGVDAVLYGHIHAAEVTWPVVAAQPTQLSFVNPKAPVHFLIGMAGAGYLGPWQAEVPAWSAWRNQVCA